MGAVRGQEAGVGEAPTARPGDVIGGKYRLEGLVAEGHRCQVMAATHLGLREVVAVKVPAPGAPLDEARARFAREARLCGRMRGQHLPRVHDVTADGSALPYLVLEYLEGQTLAAWLDDCGVLPLQRAVGCVLQACEALAELHAAGMVHGAVQPGKLLLTTGSDHSPSVKLLGLADATPSGEPRPGETTASASGTFALRFGVLAPRPAPAPRPAAPEVRTGGPIDARADVWGLGATLHELLVGAPPGVAPAAARPGSTGDGDAADATLRARRKEIPEALEDLVARALSPDPELRYGDVAAMATALVPFGPPIEAAATAERTRRLLAMSALVDGTDTTPEPPMRQSEIPTKPSMTRVDLLRAAPTPVTEPALFGEHQPTLPLLRDLPAAMAAAGILGADQPAGDAQPTVPIAPGSSRSASTPTAESSEEARAGLDSLGPTAASAAPHPPEQIEALSALGIGRWSTRRRRAAGGVTGLMIAAGALFAVALGISGPPPRARTAGWHALSGAEPIAALGRAGMPLAQAGLGGAGASPGATHAATSPGAAATGASTASAKASAAATAGKAPAKAAKPAAKRPAARTAPARTAPSKAAASGPRTDADLFTSRK
jgi:serine/threonine-protein kinase